MSKQALKNSVAQVVKTNSVNSITGANLQAKLFEMIDAMYPTGGNSKYTGVNYITETTTIDETHLNKVNVLYNEDNITEVTLLKPNSMLDLPTGGYDLAVVLIGVNSKYQAENNVLIQGINLEQIGYGIYTQPIPKELIFNNVATPTVTDISGSANINNYVDNTGVDLYKYLLDQTRLTQIEVTEGGITTLKKGENILTALEYIDEFTIILPDNDASQGDIYTIFCLCNIRKVTYRLDSNNTIFAQGILSIANVVGFKTVFNFYNLGLVSFFPLYPQAEKKVFLKELRFNDLNAGDSATSIELPLGDIFINDYLSEIIIKFNANYGNQDAVFKKIQITNGSEVIYNDIELQFSENFHTGKTIFGGFVEKIKITTPPDTLKMVFDFDFGAGEVNPQNFTTGRIEIFGTLKNLILLV